MLSFALFALTCVPQVAPDADRDHDGLSDFQEVHKYFTDPAKADTDGDGVPDGDWDERREYAYSVHAVIDVMAPFDVASMNDDYQDVRVLDQRPDLLEFEVVVYPFNTVADAIEPNSKWREQAAAMKAWTKPGLTTNWDEPMRKELVAALAKDGVDAAKLDDRALAEKASAWLMHHSQSEDGFTVFTAEFVEGKPRVPAVLQGDCDSELKRAQRTLEEQWRRELYGKSMFDERVHGTCTSSAIYLSTGLKALGLPTRTIVCVPIIDASDEREWSWLPTQITHNGVRKTITRALSGARHGWTSHTFNEVFVGNRWRRLNYSKLGQNVLDDGYLGLMVHVNTFADHADAGLIGWGLRMQHPLHDALFGGSNPYSCVALSDRFGAHAKVDNPSADDAALHALTITRLYWYDDPKKKQSVAMKLDDPDTAGHLLVHVEPDNKSANGADYKDFYEAVDKRFELRARNKPSVPCHATRGYWLNSNDDVAEFYLRIDPADFEQMASGVEYELAYVGKPDKLSWKVPPDTKITRRKG